MSRQLADRRCARASAHAATCPARHVELHLEPAVSPSGTHPTTQEILGGIIGMLATVRSVASPIGHLNRHRFRPEARTVLSNSSNLASTLASANGSSWLNSTPVSPLDQSTQ